MMTLTDLYQINGNPLPAPDEGVESSFEDLDGSGAGRDESGYMHRQVVRQKVGVWTFCYSCLSDREYAYFLSIVPKEGSFTFTYPTADGMGRETCTAYLSSYSIVWHSARTGLYRNLKFSIIQC